MGHGLVTLFLCGDVMPGRGVDQILPAPGDASLREQYIRDARTYVEAAEMLNGPIRRPVRFSWPWGSALRAIDRIAPDARLLNLETAITRSDDFAPCKDVHYRMSPGNVRCLAAGRPDVCALANNHVLDFGRAGLAETLRVLADAALRWVGAGRDVDEAQQPAIVPIAGGGRVLVFAGGMASSGIPPDWAATADRSGVNVLPDLSNAIASGITDHVQAAKQPGDVVVASLHWGPNWGYGISEAETRFAHCLIDGGVDAVHGHSSHHPRPIEVYRDKPILYGCGDFIDDYEGISGHEEYRDDLRLMYFPALERDSCTLHSLRIVPMQARKMRLYRASSTDSRWLRSVLDRISHRFRTSVELEPDGTMTARRG